MKLNPLVLLGVAGALGLAAFLGTQQMLSAQKGGEEQKVSVLIATAEILTGDPLDESNTAFKPMPASVLPPQAVTSAEQFAGMAAGSRFLPGEIVVQGKIGSQFARASHAIPEGMHVVTISVDKTKTHAGLIAPGDRVDVLGIFQQEERVGSRSERYSVSTLVLGDLEIWSVGQDLRSRDLGGAEGRGRGERTDTGTIGLLVTQAQASKLTVAEENGKLHVVLRNPDDESDPSMVQFDSRDLVPSGNDQEARRREQNARRTGDPVAGADSRTAAGRAEVTADDFPAPSADDPAATLMNAVAGLWGGASPDAAAEPEVPEWTVTVFNGDRTEAVRVIDADTARANGASEEQIRARGEALRTGTAPGGAPTRSASASDGFGFPGPFTSTPLTSTPFTSTPGGSTPGPPATPFGMRPDTSAPAPALPAPALPAPSAPAPSTPDGDRDGDAADPFDFDVLR